MRFLAIYIPAALTAECSFTDLASIGDLDEPLLDTTPSVPSAVVVPLLRMKDMTPYVESVPVRYSAAFLAAYSKYAQDFVLAQARSDEVNALSTPKLLFDSELVPLPGSPGLTKLRLGSLIARGMYTTVFNVEKRSDLVIKYRSNCDDLISIHPVLREALFMRLVSEFHLAPKVYFISPPAKFDFPVTAKTDSNIPIERRETCVSSPDSTVRFAVMEKYVDDMNGLSNSFLTDSSVLPRVRASLLACAKTIEALHGLHTRGIVHGSVHTGNVVRFGPKPHFKYGFGDFSKAFFAERRRGTVEQAVPRLTQTHCLHSPYQIEGLRTSFRDDVFGAVQMAATMMNPPAFVAYCMSLQDRPEAMLQFKTEGFMFGFPGGPDIVSQLPKSAEVKDKIREGLMRVLDIVRGLYSVDEMPPHAALVAELLSMEALLK